MNDGFVTVRDSWDLFLQILPREKSILGSLSKQARTVTELSLNYLRSGEKQSTWPAANASAHQSRGDNLR